MKTTHAQALLLALALTAPLAACKKNKAPSPGAPGAPPPLASVQAARQERLAPVVQVAPAPLPSAMPWRGEEGVRADGTPKRYVDQAAMRSLLWHGKFDELDAHFTEVQDAFEADAAKEPWVYQATSAFASAERSTEKRLDAWVAAKPKSFAAHLARGAHRAAVGWASRGDAYAKDTAKDDFRAMDAAFVGARADLDAALALRPKLEVARSYRLEMLKAQSPRAEMQKEVDAALVACPTCVGIRRDYLRALRPRWGGSYEEMLAFAKTCDVAKVPRCRGLEGFVDWDKADLARHANDLRGASDAIERAIASGPHAVFFEGRARLRAAQKDPRGELDDVQRALELLPGDANLLFLEAHARDELAQYEQAAEALLAGLRVDPTDSAAKALVPHVRWGLVTASVNHSRDGKREDAIRALDLAAELVPTDREVIGRRAYFLLDMKSGEPDVPALEAAVAQRPDDLRLHQQLDYALAKERKFDRVVAMWTAYLARHPDDGRAYVERGGAYFQLGKRTEAQADAAKACELGINEGCAHAGP